MAILHNLSGLFGAPFRNGATLGLDYPPGTTQDTFTDSDGHVWIVNQKDYQSDDDEFTLDFGASTITLTNAAGKTFGTGSVWSLQLKEFEETTGKLLGRASGENGDQVQEVEMGAGLQLTGRTLDIADGGMRQVFVATTGSDGGNGSVSHPFASLQKALTFLKGSGEIIMRDGDYENKGDMMLDLATAKNLKIRSYPYERVRIFLGEKLETFTLASGIRYTAPTTGNYTSIPFADRSINTANDFLSWIFEMDTPEGIITEPFPQQRGRTHRLDHTRLWYHATTGAVAAGNARFTYASNVLHLSASDGLTPNGRTYWIPSRTEGDSFLSGGTANTVLEVDGIEIYFAYDGIDITNVSRAIVRNCLIFGCGHEGLTGTTFGSFSEENNEFAANGGDGVGLNGPTDEGTRRAHTYCLNPWVHDNGDEGYSNHQRIISFMLGGLYENNCSSGIAHALGVQFDCQSPTTRHNGYDFAGVGVNTGNAGIYAVVEPGINCAIHNPKSYSEIVAFYNSTNGTAVTITAITRSSTVITVTTSGAHNFFVGQKVSINGVTTANYDVEGATVVTVPTSNTFTITTALTPTSPGTVGPGVVRLVTWMRIYDPIVKNPVTAAFQLSTAAGIEVFNPTLEGVNSTTLTLGNDALFVYHDKRRAFLAIIDGVTLTADPAEQLVTGWTDGTRANDICDVFGSSKWTPGRPGLVEMTLFLVSSTLTDVSVHLHKNGSTFMVLKDLSATEYKSSYTLRFYNALDADYYQIYIKSPYANINIGQNAGTYTSWFGHFVSEA